MKKCNNCGYEGEEKFCPECGTLMEEQLKEKTCHVCGTKTESKFCPECGNNMSEDSALQSTQSNTENPKPKINIDKKPIDKKIIVIIALIVIAIAIAVLLLVEPSKKTSSKSTAKDTIEEATSMDNKDSSLDKEEKVEKSGEDSLEIIESVWNYNENSKFVEYVIKIKNNSKSKTRIFPQYRLTVYDSDGNLMGTDKHTLSEIKAGETICWADFGCECTKKPDKVDFEIIDDSPDYWVSDSESEYPGIKPLSATKVNVIKDDDMLKVVGMINNKNDRAFDSVAVAIIFKEKGKIVGGDFTFVDNVKASGETPFEWDSWSDNVTEDVEVYVMPW